MLIYMTHIKMNEGASSTLEWEVERFSSSLRDSSRNSYRASNEKGVIESQVNRQPASEVVFYQV